MRLAHKYGLGEKNVRCLQAPIYTFVRATVTTNTIVTGVENMAFFHSFMMNKTQ